MRPVSFSGDKKKEKKSMFAFHMRDQDAANQDAANQDDDFSLSLHILIFLFVFQNQSCETITVEHKIVILMAITAFIDI